MSEVAGLVISSVALVLTIIAVWQVRRTFGRKWAVRIQMGVTETIATIHVDGEETRRQIAANGEETRRRIAEVHKQHTGRTLDID